MPSNPLTDPNWASDTTGTLVRLVATVREQTTTKAVFAARGLVFGIIAAFLGTFIVIITIIGLMRGIQVLLDLAVTEAQAVYLSYFTLGGIFCLVGVLLMARRHPT